MMQNAIAKRGNRMQYAIRNKMKHDAKLPDCLRKPLHWVLIKPDIKFCRLATSSLKGQRFKHEVAILNQPVSNGDAI